MASQRYILVPREPGVYGFVEKVITKYKGHVNTREFLKRTEDRFKFTPVFFFSSKIIENTFKREQLEKITRYTGQKGKSLH